MVQITRVLLADDHQMILAGLRALLQIQPGVTVVGEAADGRTAVKMAAELMPDVVVMDIDMPDLNGIDATRQIMADGKETKVIALSGHSEAKFVGQMLKAGAVGYVVKQAAFAELVTAVNTVVENRVYLSPSVAGIVVSNFVKGGTTNGQSVDKLTPREREVLQLVAEGHATKQVAADLNISVKTAETHRRSIMEKLELDSVAQLTKYAIREGITSIHA